MFEKLFDFGDVGNFMTTIVNGANQAASAARDEAKVASEQTAVIADSAADYNDQAQQTLRRLRAVEEQGNEARRLAESGNIFDRIELLGEQILNPRAYTRDGRMNQIQEMSTELAMRGQVHNVQVTAANAKIEQANADRLLATANIDSSMTKMKAMVDGLALMNGAMAQAETLRQNNLTLMELPQLQSALTGPTQNGKVTLNGMQYTQLELRERETKLLNRQKLLTLSPQAMDPEFAQKIAIQHDMLLANYDLPELEELRKNGYQMPDGTQVDPQLWDSHWNRQNALQEDALKKQYNQAILSNQLPVMAEEGMKLSTSIGKYAEPGSPLAIANRNYQAQLATIADTYGNSTAPNAKLIGVDLANKAQADVLKAVEAEATRKAAGDKQLADIYRSQIMGQEVSAAQAEDVIRGRYMNDKGLGDFLPTEVANRIRTNADTNLAALQQAQARDMTSLDGVKKSKKELREEAVNMAIEQERRVFANEGINKIQQGATQRQDNPAIKAGMVSQQVWQTQQRAAAMAWESAKQEFELNDQQVALLKAGRWQETGLEQTKAGLVGDHVNRMSVQAEYDLFDAHKPGLGYEVQSWYQTTLPEMARNYTAQLDPIQGAMAADSVLVQAQKLAARYTDADEAATQRGKQLAVEISVGARRPENMWPVLLHTSEHMAESQKSTVWHEVIEPTLKQARAQGANDETATAMAMEALNQYQSPDNATNAALKTFMRALPKSLDNFEVMWQSVLAQGSTRFRANMIKDSDRPATRQIQHVIPWLNKQQ